MRPHFTLGLGEHRLLSFAGDAERGRSERETSTVRPKSEATAPNRPSSFDDPARQAGREHRRERERQGQDVDRANADAALAQLEQQNDQRILRDLENQMGISVPRSVKREITERESNPETKNDFLTEQEPVITRLAEKLAELLTNGKADFAAIESIRSLFHEILRTADEINHAAGTTLFAVMNENLTNTGFRLTTDANNSVLTIEAKTMPEIAVNSQGPSGGAQPRRLMGKKREDFLVRQDSVVSRLAGRFALAIQREGSTSVKAANLRVRLHTVLRAIDTVDRALATAHFQSANDDVAPIGYRLITNPAFDFLTLVSRPGVNPEHG